ncbi:MAG: hypothetical protein R2911_25345 [Caldilineaceae bacterium]
METAHTNGVNALQDRLNEPATAASINRLLDRIEELEQAVTTLTSTIAQAPGLMAMAGDMVDEAFHAAAAQGIDLEARAKTGLHLLTRLTEPQMVAQVEQLMDMAAQAPGLAAMMGDMADEAMRNVASAGVDIEERARTGLQLLNRLTEPQMVQQLNQALDMAEQAPGLLAMMGDMADEAMRNVAAAGVDIEVRAHTGLQLLNRLTEPQMVQQLNQALDMAEQAPGLLAMMGDMADEAMRMAAAGG